MEEGWHTARRPSKWALGPGPLLFLALPVSTSGTESQHPVNTPALCSVLPATSPLRLCTHCPCPWADFVKALLNSSSRKSPVIPPVSTHDSGSSLWAVDSRKHIHPSFCAHVT